MKSARSLPMRNSSGGGGGTASSASKKRSDGADSPAKRSAGGSEPAGPAASVASSGDGNSSSPASSNAKSPKSSPASSSNSRGSHAASLPAAGAPGNPIDAESLVLLSRRTSGTPKSGPKSPARGDREGESATKDSFDGESQRDEEAAGSRKRATPDREGGTGRDYMRLPVPRRQNTGGRASPAVAQQQNQHHAAAAATGGERIISPISSNDKSDDDKIPTTKDEQEELAEVEETSPKKTNSPAPAAAAAAAAPPPGDYAMAGEAYAASAAAAAAAAGLIPPHAAAAAAAQYAAAAAAAAASANPYVPWNYAAMATMPPNHPGAAAAAAHTLGGMGGAGAAAAAGQPPIPPPPMGYMPIHMYYPTFAVAASIAAAAASAQHPAGYPPHPGMPHPYAAAYPAFPYPYAPPPPVPPMVPPAAAPPSSQAASEPPSSSAAAAAPPSSSGGQSTSPITASNPKAQRRMRPKEVLIWSNSTEPTEEAVPSTRNVASSGADKETKKEVGKDEPNRQQAAAAAVMTGLRHKSMNRCIVREHVFPPANWKEQVAIVDESKMPEFHRLINFPDHVTRCRMSPYAPPNGQRYCVMCGQARACPSGNEAPQPKSAAAHPDGTSGGGVAPAESPYIIPRQNKGVCTMCDVAVWTVVELDMEVKWCKGCKNFRPWPLFGDKVMATKCVRCRDRQKEKYKQKLQESNGAGHY